MTHCTYNICSKQLLECVGGRDRLLIQYNAMYMYLCMYCTLCTPEQMILSMHAVQCNPCLYALGKGTKTFLFLVKGTR